MTDDTQGGDETDNIEDVILQEEIQYLNNTLQTIQRELANSRIQIANKKQSIVDARRDMYENAAHSSEDFDRMIDMVQYAGPLQLETRAYEEAAVKIMQYEKMLQNPYFARIDFYFDEDDFEVIYIGLGNVYQKDSYRCMVYDWRTPIASVYYRYELGAASYQAPGGLITGQVRLKRQYEIQNGKLQYFFDSSVRVMDSMLKKALSANASAKMKTIVETIQREQDAIIRDVEHDLVMVQGVAGSGKTAIALHRVAYLLYQSAHSEKGTLTAGHVLLLSPNHLFGKYVSNVLPELGEKAITTETFEDIFKEIFPKMTPRSRNDILEMLMNIRYENKKAGIKNSLQFKTSDVFFKLLCRYAEYIQRHLIPFTDLYVDGQLFANRHLLKEQLLSSRKNTLPIESRLKLIEAKLIAKWEEGRDRRMEQLIYDVEEYTDHPFDSREYANRLWHKKTNLLKRQIRQFSRLNYLDLYKLLFQRKDILYHLSKGLTLPKEMDALIRGTKNRLSAGQLPYEDAMAIMALKLICAKVEHYRDIKQVMIDEVQDYAPLHFEICKRLFPNAKFTALGDVNQTVEKEEGISFYDTIAKILEKRSAVTMVLNKSYRCSYEINAFSAKLTPWEQSPECVDRHETPPFIAGFEDEPALQIALKKHLQQLLEGKYQSIAVLTKSMAQAKQLKHALQMGATVYLPSFQSETLPSGITLMPIYMAKGLEFDAVVLVGVDDTQYCTIEDKKLLYIGCTRALHYLALYYHTAISRFLA